MIMDYQNMFCINYDGTKDINVIDLGSGDTGPSEQVSVFVSRPQGWEDSVEITLVTSDAIGEGGALITPDLITFTKSFTSKIFSVAFRLPHGMKRYVTIAGNNLGITAGLVFDVQDNNPAPTGPSGI